MLTILHVSDVHFGVSDDQGEQGRITNALIKAAHEQDWRPDVCIFSGDLANRGAAEEYAEAEQWLRELIGGPWNTKLFVVPGNHDVDRVSFPLFLAEAHADEAAYTKARVNFVRNHAQFNKFQAWHADFKASLTDQVLSDWQDPFGCTCQFATDDATIDLLGLNTALLCRDDHDEGRLVQDLRTLNTMLAEPSSEDRCKIAISHHPLTWLVEWNRARVRTLLGQQTGAHLFLHGHTHDHSVTARSSADGQGLVTLQGGAAYQGSEYPQFFSLYRLQFDKREIESKLFAYSDNSGDWVPDAARSWKIVADIPHIVPTAPRPIPTESEPKAKKKGRGDLAAAVAAPLSGATQAGAEPAQRSVDGLVNAFLATLGWAGEEISSFSVRHRRSTGDSLAATGSGRAGEATLAVRLLVRNRSDIPSVTAQALGLLEDGDLRRDTERPIEFFTARGEDDPLSLAQLVREEVSREKRGIAIDVKSIGAGASFVRIPLRTDFESSTPVPALEIGDALEDLWAALDQQLRDSRLPASLSPEVWRQQLQMLKAQFDLCSQHISLINDLKAGEDAAELPRPSGRSATRPEQALERCRSIAPDMLRQLERAFELWKQADASRQFGGDADAFRRAAAAFARLLEERADADYGELGKRDFLYLVRMEQAYMLYTSGIQTDTASAEQVYREILGQHPDDMSALFRIGQCLRALGRPDDAVESLTRAIDLATQDQATEFFEGEGKFVKEHASVALGNAYFRQCEASGDPHTKYDCLAKAIEAVRGVCASPSSDLIALWSTNDLLYYVWEQFHLVESHQLDLPTPDGEELRTLCNKLEKDRAASSAGSYEYDDTLARAHVALGHGNAARQAAIRSLDWLVQVAEKRSGRNLSGGREKMSFQWVASVMPSLISADERDAFGFAADLLKPLFSDPRVKGLESRNGSKEPL